MANKLAQALQYTLCFVLLGLVGFAVVLRVPLGWLHGTTTSLPEAFAGGLGARFVGTCVALAMLASRFILNPRREPLLITCVFYLVLAFVYALVVAWPDPSWSVSAKMIGLYFLISMGAAALAAVLAMPLVYVTVRSARRLAKVESCPSHAEQPRQASA